MERGRLPSLDNFEPDPWRPDSFDAENGTFARYRINRDTRQYIIEEGEFGYERCVSADPIAFETEHDTFAADYVEATPGHGLGTAAFRQLILEALSSGLHVARLRIVNSRAIHMVERLRLDSLVLVSYYKIDRQTSLHPEVETTRFHEQPGLCTAEEAWRFLTENERLPHPEDYGSIESVVWF